MAPRSDVAAPMNPVPRARAYACCAKSSGDTDENATSTYKEGDNEKRLCKHVGRRKLATQKLQKTEATTGSGRVISTAVEFPPIDIYR